MHVSRYEVDLFWFSLPMFSHSRPSPPPPTPAHHPSPNCQPQSIRPLLCCLLQKIIVKCIYLSLWWCATDKIANKNVLAQQTTSVEGSFTFSGHGPVLSFKPGIDQNVVLHASPTARKSAFVMSMFLVHSTLLLLQKDDLNFEQWIRLVSWWL